MQFLLKVMLLTKQVSEHLHGKRALGVGQDTCVTMVPVFRVGRGTIILYLCYKYLTKFVRERSGSVVECLI